MDTRTTPVAESPDSPASDFRSPRGRTAPPAGDEREATVPGHRIDGITVNYVNYVGSLGHQLEHASYSLVRQRGGSWLRIYGGDSLTLTSGP